MRAWSTSAASQWCLPPANNSVPSRRCIFPSGRYGFEWQFLSQTQLGDPTDFFICPSASHIPCESDQAACSPQFLSHCRLPLSLALLSISLQISLIKNTGLEKILFLEIQCLKEISPIYIVRHSLKASGDFSLLTDANLS